MVFYSLHNHDYASNVRFLDSINKPQEMVDKAIALGFSGIAFTNHECLSDEIEILSIRDSLAKTHPGFKLIFGNEIYLTDEKHTRLDLIDFSGVPSDSIRFAMRQFHFILIARDEIGYAQLKELSARAWNRAYKYRNVWRPANTYADVEQVIGENRGHLFASSACVGGEIPQDMLFHDGEDARFFIPWCVKTFGKSNFFIEVQASDLPDQVAVNSRLVSVAKSLGLGFIATTDSHYLNKEDLFVQEVFLNSEKADSREVDSFYRYTYIQSLDEMRELLVKSGLTPEDSEAAMANTARIGDACVDYDPRCSTIVPSRPIEPFAVKGVFSPYYERFPMLKQFAESPSDQDRFLFHLIEDGAIEKSMVNETVADRLNTELSVVDTVSNGLKQKLSSYFILMRKVIDLAWNNSLVAPGRGSSGGFLINYLIGLIQINPLAFDLPYWRFLNNSRFELPDIDSDFSPVVKDRIMDSLRAFYGEDNVLNCVTFKTESLRSAILAACRGLGINNHDAQALASSVPIDRGHICSLSECINGNDELGIEPVPGFEARVKQYPHLFETLQKIEGVKANSSIHASAVYIFNNGYLEHNCLMRAPNGTRITAFDMDDTNALSGLKIDLLYTDAESKLMKCMDILLEAGQMEWQGSLRKTYNKYLHPDVLDYDDPKMWDDAADGRIPNLFQYETQVGARGIKLVRPHNVIELATVNSAMRVMASKESDMQPLDRYAAFHANPSLWEKEMENAGLTEAEKAILRKYLSKQSGCSIQQEDFMRLAMDPNISGFSMADANKLRKVVAHKKLDELGKMKDKFFADGAKCGARQQFLDYVWGACIEPLSRYSFSVIHAVGYSIVAVQEMNLAAKFDPLYWRCACLCVNAGEAETPYIDEKNGTPAAEDTNRGTPNYGKIAKAISDAQQEGTTISYPDINRAGIDFIPNAQSQKILYSLPTISGVNDALAKQIINGRPYASLADFAQKIHPTPSQMTALIKAGCFDALEEKPREQIASEWALSVGMADHPLKESPNITDIKKAVDMRIIPERLGDAVRALNFQSFANDPKSKQYDAANRCYLFTSAGAQDYCRAEFANAARQVLGPAAQTAMHDTPLGIQVNKGQFEKTMAAMIAPLREWANSPEGKDACRMASAKAEADAIMSDKFGGSVSSWEIASLCCYIGPHELASANPGQFKTQISDFFSLPETAKPIGTYTNPAGFSFNEYSKTYIMGTVVDSDNDKHIAMLLTPTGFVEAKFSKQSYELLNKVVSSSSGKKKTILDASWFDRGVKLVLNGYRSDNLFRVSADWKGGMKLGVAKIESVGSDGSLKIRSARRSSRSQEEDETDGDEE